LWVLSAMCSAPRLAGGLQVSCGVVARVGYVSARVVGRMEQRYAARYLVAEERAMPLVHTAPVNGAVAPLPLHPTFPAGNHFGLFDQQDWHDMRKHFMTKLEIPGKIWSLQPPALLINNNPARQDVLEMVVPGGAANADRYAIVDEKNVRVKSREITSSMGYMHTAAEGYLRAMVQVHKAASLGAEVGWTLNIGGEGTQQDLVLGVFRQEKHWNVNALGGGTMSVYDDIYARGYTAFSQRMAQGVGVRLQVNERQRLSGLVALHFLPPLTLLFSCGMRYFDVTCELNGRIGFPHAGTSLRLGGRDIAVQAGGGQRVVGDNHFLLDFSDVRLNKGVWGPVLGVGMEYPLSMGRVSVGFEYSSAKCVMEKHTLSFDNPNPAEGWNSFELQVYGWHMSEVKAVAHDFYYTVNVDKVAVNVGFVFCL